MQTLYNTSIGDQAITGSSGWLRASGLPRPAN
jgi:hypothetical protein